MPLLDHDRTYLFKMVTKHGGVHVFFKTAIGAIYKYCLDQNEPPDGEMVLELLGTLAPNDLVRYRRAIRLLYEVFPGVDENVDGRINYHGFTGRQNAPELLLRAKDAMGQVKN